MAKQQIHSEGQPPKAADKGDTVKLTDLVDRVVASSGQKKAEATKAVKATLAVLAGAIEAGEVLALPPLGRLTLAKRKTTAKGEILTLKLRRGGAEKTARQPLAAEDE